MIFLKKVHNYCQIINLLVKTSEAYENFQIGVKIYKSKLQ